MNKKVYQVPSMTVKNLFMQSLLQDSIQNNAGINDTPQAGDGTGPSNPRSRHFSVWDDDADWDN